MISSSVARALEDGSREATACMAIVTPANRISVSVELAAMRRAPQDQIEPRLQAANPQSIERPPGKRERDGARRKEPGALIVLRLDLEDGHVPGFAARVAWIARRHAEPEPSGGQVRVERLASRPGIDPRPVEAFEQVAERGACGRDKLTPVC
jgi:hypothetical protein